MVIFHQPLSVCPCCEDILYTIAIESIASMTDFIVNLSRKCIADNLLEYCDNWTWLEISFYSYLNKTNFQM